MISVSHVTIPLFTVKFVQMPDHFCGLWMACRMCQWMEMKAWQVEYITWSFYGWQCIVKGDTKVFTQRLKGRAKVIKFEYNTCTWSCLVHCSGELIWAYLVVFGLLTTGLIILYHHSYWWNFREPAVLLWHFSSGVFVQDVTRTICNKVLQLKRDSCMWWQDPQEAPILQICLSSSQMDLNSLAISMWL